MKITNFIVYNISVGNIKCKKASYIEVYIFLMDYIGSCRGVPGNVELIKVKPLIMRLRTSLKVKRAACMSLVYRSKSGLCR